MAKQAQRQADGNVRVAITIEIRPGRLWAGCSQAGAGGHVDELAIAHIAMQHIGGIEIAGVQVQAAICIDIHEAARAATALCIGATGTTADLHECEGSIVEPQFVSLAAQAAATISAIGDKQVCVAIVVDVRAGRAVPIAADRCNTCVRGLIRKLTVRQLAQKHQRRHVVDEYQIEAAITVEITPQGAIVAV